MTTIDVKVELEILAKDAKKPQVETRNATLDTKKGRSTNFEIPRNSTFLNGQIVMPKSEPITVDELNKYYVNPTDSAQLLSISRVPGKANMLTLSYQGPSYKA